MGFLLSFYILHSTNRELQSHKTYRTYLFNFALLKPFFKNQSMILKIIPLLGIVVVFLISGCTQNPDKINLKITSIEHKFGVPGFVGCTYGPSRNYFLITVKNNGKDVGFGSEYNDIRFCSDFELPPSCSGTFYNICPSSFGIGEWDNYTFALIPQSTPLDEDTQIYNETGFCGKSFKIQMAGRHWIEFKTPGVFQNPKAEEKSGWSEYYIIDELWVTVSC